MTQINAITNHPPQIYCYTTPGVTYHDGWIKVGDTQGEFERRIGQQTNTAGIIAEGYLLGFAVYLDGSNKTFRDHAFHEFLIDNGINNIHPGWPGDEWFEISMEKLKQLFDEFVHNPPLLHKLSKIILRDEQETCVSKMVDYRDTHEKGEFLLNAKPRFGKTISALEFCKRTNAQNVLVLTNMPAVANSWYEDYMEYLGSDSGYIFVSQTQDLKGKLHVYTREEYVNLVTSTSGPHKCFEFVSLQDLKGSVYYGGSFNKLKELYDIKWDLLFVDESHEGVLTQKTSFALEKIKRDFTLYLSGTPFKQIKSNLFDTENIFNWTYVDEQAKKTYWCGTGRNPYEELPRLNMYTYKLSRLIGDDNSTKVNSEEIEYKYRLDKFLETNSKNEFVYKDDVSQFLDALVTRNNLPFSSEVSRERLTHTLWLVPSVSAAIALTNTLKNHNIFKEYEILNVAGNIKETISASDEYESENAAYGMVRAAIKNHKKTITITVKRLCTGVTIPEWTGVMILSEIKSPQMYMQAAFRAQNPCIFGSNASNFMLKTDSFVFDFNPERSLEIIEVFANGLYAETAEGRGPYELRKQHIENLLQYLPVFGEDDNGNLISLNSEQVLSIPRKIRCHEVVRRGFMSSLLLSEMNLSRLFRNQNFLSIIGNMNEYKDNGKRQTSHFDESTELANEMYLDNKGNVDIPNEVVTNAANSVSTSQMHEVVKKHTSKLPTFAQQQVSCSENTEKKFKTEAEKIAKELTDALVSQSNITVEKSTVNKLFNNLKLKTENELISINMDKNIEMIEMRQAYLETFDDCSTDDVDVAIQEDLISIEEKYNKIQEQRLMQIAEQFKKDGMTEILTRHFNQEKEAREDEIKKRLKGFLRTIPSFLMAYGDYSTRLENLEQNIPDDVFVAVTSIHIKDFITLRDGYDETLEDGTINHEPGVFDFTVFNDSIKEFLYRKTLLSNYFDESVKEDIFDYIPLQETNQKFTPKHMVSYMVDQLEVNNPGCFDDPDKTFIDIYMKSGLFITEIVKRLYRSEKMKELYPDPHDRLKHIFEHQVYGLAPTEIIYRIAMSFIFGSKLTRDINTKHIVCFDAQPYAENGTLETKLDEIFSE